MNSAIQPDLAEEKLRGLLGQKQTPRRHIRVFLLDLWCFIPYYMAALAEHLDGNGTNVALLSSSYRLHREYFREKGLRNNPGLLDVASRFEIHPGWLRRLLKLAEYCLNLVLLSLRVLVSPPDIMHAQFLVLLSRGLPCELWVLGLAQKRGGKLVCTVHNLLPHDSGNKYRKQFQKLYAMSDALICHNRATRDRLIHEFGIERGRIRVIAHGPLQQPKDPPDRNESLRLLSLPTDRTIVLCQGVIAQYKGIDFLLDTWRLVSPRAYLVIAGTGQAGSLEAIRAKVRKLESATAGNIRLDFKFIPPESLPHYYQAAHILVYPYKQITTSGALMTGLGYGKAIVATKLPVFEEMLRDGQDCLMIEYGNREELARAINSLVDNPSLMSALGNQAESLVRTRYSWKEIALQTRQVYDELIAGEWRKASVR